MKYLVSLLMIVFLSACSSGGREERSELKKFYLTGAYDQGLQFLEKSKFYQDKNEKLLGLMEKGMLLHAKGEWEQSSKALDEARELSAKLYTISVSKKAEKALLFIIINATLFVVATYFINPICFYLSPVALFVILFYSYTKRFTYLCHLVLGVGLSLAPIGAYLAVTGSFALLPLLFSFAVVFWVSGFDIIYALQDIDFDKSQSLYSIPSYWGLQQALNIARVLHIFSAAFIIAAYFVGGFNFIYLGGMLVFIGMLLYQHSIVKPNDLSKVNIAFMTANGIASIVFSVFVIASLIVQIIANIPSAIIKS